MFNGLALTSSCPAVRRRGEPVEPVESVIPDAPVLSINAGSSDTDPSPLFDIELDGTEVAGDQIHLYNDGVLAGSYTLTAEDLVDSTIEFGLTDLAEGAHPITATHENGAGESAPSNEVSITVDTTAPTLSSPTGTQTGTTTANIAVTTNEGNGILYRGVWPSASAPNADAIIAGTGAVVFDNVEIDSTGEKSTGVTGLSAATAYKAHFVQEDAAGNRSVVASSAEFTTASAGGSVSIEQTAFPESVGAFPTATHTNVAIGAAAAGRIIAVAVAGETAQRPISATIDSGDGPIAMTAGQQESWANVNTRIFYALVPTGTTATIAVTWDGSVGDTANRIAPYRVTGARTTLHTDGKNAVGDMNATPLSTGSITIPTGGALLAVVASADHNAAKTWTGATEDIDSPAWNFRISTAILASAGAATVTCASGVSENGSMSYVVFEP